MYMYSPQNSLPPPQDILRASGTVATITTNAPGGFWDKVGLDVISFNLAYVERGVYVLLTQHSAVYSTQCEHNTT
jgi:hypothetical protein